MTENPEDPDKFTPTDWDWVMFLSGEINAIETRFDTVGAIVTATLCAFMGFIIVFLGLILDSISPIIVILVVVTFGFACCVSLIYKKKKHEEQNTRMLFERC
jgi:FtsH-binding integral membrane protein